MRDDRQTAFGACAAAFAVVQFPLTLAIVAYYPDPSFAMYTTTMRNITTRDMDVEVEDYNASVAYVLASALGAVFAAGSRGLGLDTMLYSTEAMDELSMWDLGFWLAVTIEHACLLAFMCSPVDWYFLALMVAGITFLLNLLSRLPLASNRSRENLLLLLAGLLFLMLYSTVRKHHHGVYFIGLVAMDGLLLVGHTYDAQPDMFVVGNSRLCYVSGMSALMLATYISG